jgi:hypothetical protein
MGRSVGLDYVHTPCVICTNEMHSISVRIWVNVCSVTVQDSRSLERRRSANHRPGSQTIAAISSAVMVFHGAHTLLLASDGLGVKHHPSMA